MHKSSYENMRKFVDKYFGQFKSKSIQILDIGSQDVNGSYKNLFHEPDWQYSGLDICEGKNVDIVVKDIYKWNKVRSNVYDVVISGQAFEHIEFFWLTMKEVARVLKPNGLCCIIAPSSGPEHKYPVDCYRFFPDGLAAIAKYAKLEIIETYTCWESEICGDNNIWKDSVLVCKKTQEYHGLKPIKNRIKLAVGKIHKLF